MYFKNYKNQLSLIRMARILTLKRQRCHIESFVELQIGNTIREHDYYRCFNVKTKKGDKMLLWKLHCAANPFISLLQLFKLFAISTKKLVSRKLVRFIVKCWKAYKQSKSMKDLQLEFYQGNGNVKNKIKIAEIDEINKIMRMIQKMNHQQMDRFAQQYQSSSIKENGLEVEDCAFFAQKADKILQKIKIMPHQQRMKKLDRLCAELTHWKAQLLSDNTTAYILTIHEFSGKQTTQILTLQQLVFFNAKNNLVQISEETIQNLSNNLLEQLFNLDGLNQINSQSYPLDVDSILIQTKRGQNNKILVGNNCQIDLIKLFLYELGLTNEISTIQNLIIFHSKHKPQITSFSFKEVLKQHFKITDVNILKTEIAIKWILISDYMLVSRLKPSKSILQTQDQKIKIINSIIGIQENQNIHYSTKLLIDLIKLDNYVAQTPTQILEAICLKNIKIASQSEADNGCLFDPNRYLMIKSSIQLKVKLFFEKQNLKDYCETNKCIKSLDSHGKYIIMYLLCHYALVQTQRQFLELWGGQQVKINDQNDPLRQALNKFNKILPKIEIHIDQIDNSTPKWGPDIKNDMKNILNFCKTLKGRNFGASYQNLSSQNQQTKLKDTKNIIKQIKKHLGYLFGLLRKDLNTQVQTQQKWNSKIGNSSYLNGRKNLCLKHIFTSLNLYNYSEMYCEEATLTGYKPILSQITKKDIKQYFDQADKRLSQYSDKEGHFFQETLTTLTKHEQLGRNAIQQ